MAQPPTALVPSLTETTYDTAALPPSVKATAESVPSSATPGESKALDEQTASAISREAKENPCEYLLSGTPAKALNKNRELVGLYANDTLKSAVITLSLRRILGAPVFDANENCIGSFDMLDAVK